MVLVPDEPLLGAEGEPPQVGVHSIGADHQVEAADGSALEGDRHTVGVLLQGPDRVTESDLHVIGRFAQQCDQVAPHDLDRGSLADADPSDGAVGGVDELHAVHVGGQFADAVHEAHSLGHGDRVVAYVHPVASGAQLGGAFNDGGPQAVPGQPIGQGESGDAGSGDQDPLVHGGSSR